MVQFRPIEEVKDLESVRQIYNYYVRTTTVSFDIEPASIEKIREMTIHSDDRYCSFVICDEQHVVGYVLLSPFIKKHSANRTAEITIYLDPEYKGRGIGGQAISYLEEQALERGFHTLIAVICTENEASLQRFERSGYTLKGVINEVGYKFDRYLDLAYMSKMIP